MNCLRSRFIGLLIALFILGSSLNMLGANSCRRDHCCEAPHAELCPCLCHAAALLEPLAPPSLAGRLPTATLTFLETGVFPPDALPLGVDYPPRLG